MERKIRAGRRRIMNSPRERLIRMSRPKDPTRSTKHDRFRRRLHNSFAYALGSIFRNRWSITKPPKAKIWTKLDRITRGYRYV